MDWARAIERNREALRVIVAGLFAMLEMAGGAGALRVPRTYHRALLRVLQPAESAVRRLIVIVARGVAVKLPASRPMPPGRIIQQGACNRIAFQLFDPRKRFADHVRRPSSVAIPRIHIFASDPRVAAHFSTLTPSATPAPPPDGTVSAERLSLRLNALKSALDDLPRQARRLARWRARREILPGLKFKLPLRPGHPPGYRKTQVHDVDHVLAECHGLAFDVLSPDTS